MKPRPAPALALALLAVLPAACRPATAATGATPLVGLIDATEIDVASKIPGRVATLAVREGDRVEAGQPLLTIDSDELQAKVDQVQAAIDGAEARLKMAQAGARKEEKEAARQALETARHQHDVARKTYDRVAALLAEQAVAPAQFDDVEARLNVARDQLAMAQARYDLVLRGARGEEIEALRALVAQGHGSLAEVQTYTRETTQRAPIRGEVAKIIVHQGELAATGYPILTIVSLDDVWASFAVREDRLRRIQPGARFDADVPALGRRVRMEVAHIAALGDFATWKATTDRNSFDLKSFEVKARPVDKVDGLRPGMTVRWLPE
jgi:HlyD family secretion protein